MPACVPVVCVCLPACLSACLCTCLPAFLPTCHHRRAQLQRTRSACLPASLTATVPACLQLLCLPALKSVCLAGSGSGEDGLQSMHNYYSNVQTMRTPMRFFVRARAALSDAIWRPMAAGNKSQKLDSRPGSMRAALQQRSAADCSTTVDIQLDIV